MINRTIPALVAAACLLSPLASFAAENNANIAPVKGSIVHMTLKNLSNLTQNLVIQGRTISLATNQNYAIEVPAGTEVYGADKTIKLTVVKEYNGSVASFR